MKRISQVLLSSVFIALWNVPVFAQSLREVFQRFPLKRPEVSMTPSRTNKVVYDATNGYLSIKTTTNPDTQSSEQTVFVLFLADDGTKYYAHQEINDPGGGDGCKRSTLKMYLLDAGEWRDVTSQLLPSVRISEFYGQKSTPNLIDVKGIISYTPDDNQRGIGLGIDYTLPQIGTTIQASLAYRCENDVTPEYLKLYKECKFKMIELLWNKQNGWFIMGKKR
ncbi:MAG: hypothetical protein JNN25_05440 [Candidatus Kapabacteria bacterium]|nr:hypothetical protein [Candidatus Kapabacteria bacterium]